MSPRKREALAAKFEELTIKDAEKMLGIREAKDGEKGIAVNTKDGKIKVVMEKNVTNRPFSIGLSKQYADQMLKGEWAGQWNNLSRTPAGESWILDWDGHIVSCAHRCFALFLAEHERQRLAAAGCDERIEELGCKKPITIKALVVRGVDPATADFADTGKNRSLGDVLFRRHEYDGKDLNESQIKRLSRELAVAVRLVWLRTNGEQVARGSKLHHPEALAFLEKHPRLHDAVLHIFHEEGGSGVDGKKISDYISIGYAAGMMYLAGYMHSDAAKVHNGEIDMSRKPATTWDQAEDFWTRFANQDFSGGKKGEVVKSIHTILSKNAKAVEKHSRDALCTLITRAYLVWSGEEKDKWQTIRALSSKLTTKDGDKEVLQLERFGGIDLDKEVLAELGLVDSAPVSRTSVDDWKVGDTCWVNDEDAGPWFGTIEAFSDDGKEVGVFSKEDDTSYRVDVSTLCVEQPEYEDEEVEAEEEEVEELVEA